MAIRACIAVAAGLLAVTSAAAGQGNGRIAYARDRSVYVAEADGSGEKAITTWPFYLDYGTQPVWSPDGGHLAYLAAILSPGILEVVPAVAAPDGSGPRELASHGSFRVVCWLDPATLVAVSMVEVSTNPATLAYDLYAFGLDGSTQRLTTDGGIKFFSPQACARDGSAVAYSKLLPDYTRQASVVGRDGSPPTVLTPAGSSDEAPSWSPAGDQLAFTRYQPEPGLYVSAPTGAGLTRLTPLRSDVIRWSPDGAEILFTSVHVDSSGCSRYGCPASNQIRTITPDASHQLVLAEEGEGEGWSPDGQRVAFSIGLRSLVMNPDGSCKTLLPANLPPSFAWQPVNEQPPAPELTCADLSVSADTQQLDLPLNGTADYTLTVTNKGNRQASAVSLDQRTDEGVTLTSVQPSQGSCSIDAGIHCSLGALAVGASARVVVNIAVPRPLTTVLSPQVSAPEADGYPFDNTARFGLKGFDCTILGTVGADTLYGTSRGDRICGRGGNDTIYGNAGNDVIFGNDGSDVIYGGRGRDILEGDGGNDVILARDGQQDAIDGGTEPDTAVVDRSDNVIYCRTVYRPAKLNPHHAKKRSKLKR